MVWMNKIFQFSRFIQFPFNLNNYYFWCISKHIIYYATRIDMNYIIDSCRRVFLNAIYNYPPFCIGKRLINNNHVEKHCIQNACSASLFMNDVIIFYNYYFYKIIKKNLWYRMNSIFYWEYRVYSRLVRFLVQNMLLRRLNENGKAMYDFREYAFWTIYNLRRLGRMQHFCYACCQYRRTHINCSRKLSFVLWCLLFTEFGPFSNDFPSQVFFLENVALSIINFLGNFMLKCEQVETNFSGTK